MSAEPLGLLYLCYLPLSEPLVESQVRAYLRALAAAGHRVHLLTFETRRMSTAERRAARERLAAEGIRWHHARYHKRPSLAATAFDTAVGALAAIWIARRHRLRILHARVHVPAAMALLARRAAGAGLLFDVRGLMAEEYVDGGMWREGSTPFRLVKMVERRALVAAEGVIVLTDRARRHLFGDRWATAAGAPVSVIPSCAEAARIGSLAGDRDAVRARFGLTDSRVLVYAGKFSTWYMQDEMATFFARAASVDPELRFLVLTQSDPALINDALARAGAGAERVTVTSCPPEEIGSFLAAGDLALSFIAEVPSKLASSPTKIGEYLAAGLPVISSPGIGDVDALLADHRVGVTVAGHEAGDHATAYAAALALAAEDGVSARCRRVAEEELSVEQVGGPRYVGLYTEIARRRAARGG